MPLSSKEFVNIMGLMDDLDIFSPWEDGLMVHPNRESRSDNIWDKFDLNFPELADLPGLTEEEKKFLTIETTEDSGPRCIDDEDEDILVISNHDCMWAGHCANKEHPCEEPRLVRYTISKSSPFAFIKTPVPISMIRENKPPATSQQSLLKPTVRAAASVTPMMSLMHTPQTPPMSDDEESKCKPSEVLQILNQTISECDLDEDSDLCDYREEFFEDDEDLDEDLEVDVTDSNPIVNETAKPNIRTCQFAAENDHSYHKDQNASMHVPNLGIDTPSDSEEEIDVVSVTGEKAIISNKICSLPTNPSTRDRQQIQRRMATAISKNRGNNGIKTILPIRKTTENSQMKRKLPESRGVKRTRQYRSTSTNPPFKRRATLGNSSDSEAEPSEKRSLHNNMERQRRIDLRNAFEDLRILIPEVSKKEKAAKVVILREAAKYCYQLGNVSLECNSELSDLKKEQEQLRRRVSQLRRSLAATR